jgi:hypothetical protein
MNLFRGLGMGARLRSGIRQALLMKAANETAPAIGGVEGPVTFCEIAYPLLNQTMVVVRVP